MKTVDVLIAARNFFINDPSRWTAGALHKLVDGKDCFCAIGAMSLVSGCISESGLRAQRVVVSCTLGPTGFINADYSRTTPIAALSAKLLSDLEKDGIHLKAGAGAAKYLEAACRKLFGHSVITVNDGCTVSAHPRERTLGYQGIMKAFDLAIKNAKRRHITGDRKKSVKATCVVGWKFA